MSTNVRARLRPWLLLLGLAPSAAWATPNFPDAMQKGLSLPSSPSCAVCHQGAEAMGTVVTPFGMSLLQRGLSAYDETSLQGALAGLQEQHVDSDGDGTPDVEELRANGDPNRAPPRAGEAVLVDPRYGCSSTGGGGTGATLGAALLLLAALAQGRRLRTRVSAVHAGVPSTVGTSQDAREAFRALTR